MSGYALRDLDAPAVRQVVCNAGARKVWQPIAVSTPASPPWPGTIYRTAKRETAPGPGTEPSN
jgi:hypothetical protein